MGLENKSTQEGREVIERKGIVRKKILADSRWQPVVAKEQQTLQKTANSPERRKMQKARK